MNKGLIAVSLLILFSGAFETVVSLTRLGCRDLFSSLLSIQNTVSNVCVSASYDVSYAGLTVGVLLVVLGAIIFVGENTVFSTRPDLRYW